jgi:hypothetical protein
LMLCSLSYWQHYKRNYKVDIEHSLSCSYVPWTSLSIKKNLWKSQYCDSYCELWILQFCFNWLCCSAFIKHTTWYRHVVAINHVLWLWLLQFAGA